jgi:hypothetical protein
MKFHSIFQKDVSLFYFLMFPGMNHVNGTVEGAMKAGLEAYPD